MRKWVKLDNANNVIAAYEVDVQQLVDKEVITDKSIEELIGLVYVDVNTLIETPKTLGEQQEEKIDALVQTFNDFYQGYLRNYPDVEINSFGIKHTEAMKVRQDSNVALEETPMLTSLTANGTIEERNTLANSVLAKIDELVAMEKAVADTRARILAATTEQELADIIW